MAGPRAAALVDLEFLPGYVTTRPPRSTKGRWKTGDRVRFHKGMPEKIGGWWQADLGGSNSGAYLGVCRGTHDWSSLDTQQWVAIGTHCKLYLVNSNQLYDITPIRKTSNLSAPFTTSIGSAFVTVTDVDHRASTGDYITVSDATAVGGITPSGSYQVTVVDPNTYTITHGSAATGAATGGGTPTITYDISAGLEENGELLGFGTSTFGTSTFGTPRGVGTGIPAKMRTWSLWNWGEDLIASYNTGELYWWDRTNGPNSRAILINEAPTDIQRMVVNQENETIVLLGCSNLTGDPDAMRVRWNSEGNLHDWEPSETNTAGGKRLDYGSRLVSGLLSRGQILVWSDTHMYAMPYVGGADVYGFNPLGAVSIVGPSAAIDVNGVTYLMGFKDFYVYDGTLRVLPCDVWAHVFEDFDDTQTEKVYASSYKGKNEVVWHYPKIDGSIGYVTLNTAENCWYFGTMERTCYHDASEAVGGTMSNPYGFNGGHMFIHEYGVDEVELGTLGMNWHLESWDISAYSDRHFLVNNIVPDFSRMDIGMNAYLKFKSFPQDADYVTKGPYVVDEGLTTNLDVRGRGSQMALRLEALTDGGTDEYAVFTGMDFRLGVWQIQATPYGGR